MAKWKIYQNPVNGHTEKVKEGFNWVVFLFGPIWYLFNNMVGKGLAWLIVAIIAGYLTFGIGAIIVWIVAGSKANKDKENHYLQMGWNFVGYDDD